MKYIIDRQGLIIDFMVQFGNEHYLGLHTHDQHWKSYWDEDEDSTLEGANE